MGCCSPAAPLELDAGPEGALSSAQDAPVPQRDALKTRAPATAAEDRCGEFPDAWSPTGLRPLDTADPALLKPAAPPAAVRDTVGGYRLGRGVDWRRLRTGVGRPPADDADRARETVGDLAEARRAAESEPVWVRVPAAACPPLCP